MGKLGKLHSVCTAFRNDLRFLFIITGFAAPCKAEKSPAAGGAFR
ncbi:hypothetical protein SUBVAR_06299 [Subdoligranulum variabile DSM 15176]|uniref:Uncharacterized protein n=1 Tax=Subdoligranulum variabile DSM 15176 TaxID=411471 RepID=D1PPI3_9FIRM|nr:hypothetical protein SUBVAR_06299 [Subdoligranulum variabile DSM 15176]